MPEATTAIEPIVKKVDVGVSPDVAYRIFTEEIASWWPLATHSVGGERATSVRVDGRVGGLVEEVGIEGPLRIWGTVTDWDPPALFGFTFHPGVAAGQAGHVAVRFTAAGSGTTVELTHGGWENSAGGQARRENYNSGWDVVLGAYVSAASGG